MGNASGEEVSAGKPHAGEETEEEIYKGKFVELYSTHCARTKVHRKHVKEKKRKNKYGGK